MAPKTVVATFTLLLAQRTLVVNMDQQDSSLTDISTVQQQFDRPCWAGNSDTRCDTGGAWKTMLWLQPACYHCWDVRSAEFIVMCGKLPYKISCHNCL